MKMFTLIVIAAIACQCNGQLIPFLSHRPSVIQRPSASHCLDQASGRWCSITSSSISRVDTPSPTASATSYVDSSIGTPTSVALSPPSTSIISSSTSATFNSSSFASRPTAAAQPYTRGANYGPASKSYKVPAGFPKSVFTSYYIAPAATAQPQPAIFDKTLGKQFPLNLTNPATIPVTYTDPYAFPDPIGNFTNTTAIQEWATNSFEAILNGSAGIAGNCSRCVAAMEVAQTIVQQAPLNFPLALAAVCTKMKYNTKSYCDSIYGGGPIMAIWATIFQHADMKGQDGQWICSRLFEGQPAVNGPFCSDPQTVAQSTKGIISKPKPLNAAAPSRSGKTVKVVHTSDIHLDPRYAVGVESQVNCGVAGCCRPDPKNGTITHPAPLYGSSGCDAPYNLIVSALESIGPLTNTSKDVADNGIAFSLFTGDLSPHERHKQTSFDYLMYTESATYQMLNYFSPKAPVYATLGNHDTGPESFDAPYLLPGTFGQQQELNYQHLADLWSGFGWIDSETASEVKQHFAAYSIIHPKYPKLKIISLNTDLWYVGNSYAFLNSAHPDNSGLFTFLASELQAAEDAHQRVWILGHVPPGSGFALPFHSDLFYQIVDRYSPHVIANLFFGHTHADQMNIFYSLNGTSQIAANALTPAWIAPSLTPMATGNGAWRFYEVDTGDFNIYDSYTFITNGTNIPLIDPARSGPVWELEYSARDAYGPGIPGGWPADAPLNATFWHNVSEAMKKNSTLVGLFTKYQVKSSDLVASCSSASCAKGVMCLMRSGSSALRQTC